MDTKYFRQALEEFALKRSAQIKAGDLTVGELSWLLRRAQELKEAELHDDLKPVPMSAPPVEFLQGKPQPVVKLLDRAKEIR